MEISIVLERHDGQRLLVMDSTYTEDTDDARQIIETGCAFAHVAGLEIYVSINQGEWIHYPNVDFLDFITTAMKRIK